MLAAATVTTMAEDAADHAAAPEGRPMTTPRPPRPRVARRRTVVRALALVTIAIAGCSTDPVAAPTSDAATTDEAPTDPSSPVATTDPAGTAVFCDALLEFDTISPPGGASGPTAEQMQAYASEIGPLVAAMEESAPTAATAAVTTMAAGVERAATGDAGVGEDADLSAAVETIEDTARTVCGFPELEVTAVDFSFDAPARIPAGPHSLRLVNTGEAPHLMLLVGAPEDDSDDVSFVTSYLGAMGQADETGDAGGIAEFVNVEGNAPFADPGGSATVTGSLEPGTYILFCPLPMDFSDPESAAHFQSGMIDRVVVEG